MYTNHKPARHGFPWEREELVALAKAVIRGDTLAKIAERHKRSHRAISMMADSLALNPTPHQKGGTTPLIINGVDYDRKLETINRLIAIKLELR